MDAGEAAVQAATITVVGTVLVAAVTLVGSVIGPWIREATGRRTSREEARRDRIRILLIRFQELMLDHWVADAARDRERFDRAMAEATSVATELSLWATEKESTLVEATRTIAHTQLMRWKTEAPPSDDEVAAHTAFAMMIRDWATGRTGFEKRWTLRAFDNAVARWESDLAP